MWFKIKNQEVELKIFVKPNAKQTELVKINELGLNIAIHAKPHEGEANKELIAYLARFFNVPKSRVIIMRGQTSRNKIVSIPLNAKVHEFITSAEQNIKK